MVVGGRHDRNYHVAVVTDEASAVGAASLRDRVRWQYSTLEALGWTVVSLWTLDVFMDPDAAIEQVLAALGESRPEDGPDGVAGVGVAPKVIQPAFDIEVEHVELVSEEGAEDRALEAARGDGNPFAIADLRGEASPPARDTVDASTQPADEPHPQTLGISALIDEQIGGAPDASVQDRPDTDAAPESAPESAVETTPETESQPELEAKSEPEPEPEPAPELEPVVEDPAAQTVSVGVPGMNGVRESEEQPVTDSEPSPAPSYSMGFGVPKLALPEPSSRIVGGSTPQAEVEVDAEAAAAGEADSDSDSDAESDDSTEMDADGGGETDSETDGGGEGNTDGSTDTDADADTDAANADALASEAATEKPAKKTPESDVKARHRGADRPLIPTRAWEDVDEAWGGSRGGSSRDDEIRRDKPPHW
jgi:hypothetical protein